MQVPLCLFLSPEVALLSLGWSPRTSLLLPAGDTFGLTLLVYLVACDHCLSGKAPGPLGAWLPCCLSSCFCLVCAHSSPSSNAYRWPSGLRLPGQSARHLIQPHGPAAAHMLALYLCPRSLF